MKVIYKCRCSKAEIEIDVVERDPQGDIADWLEGIVTPAVSYDHRRRARFCREPKMEYVKLPMDPATGAVGAKTEPN